MTVCMHVHGQQNTTASMVVEVPTGATPDIRIRAALGNPCVSVYVPFTFDAPVPDVLGDERAWWRFARLRDRVERDPDTISGIRARLASVEAELAARSRARTDSDAALTALGV